MASSRASLNPNYDEASLNQRTTLISKRPRAPTPEIRTQRGHKKTDTEQIGSPTSNGSHRQPSQSYSDGLYAAVDVVGTNPRTLQPDTSCPGQYAGRSVPDEMPEADGPVYAVLEEAELQEARADQSNNKDGDGLQVQTDFDYVDQQPPLPHPAGDEDDRLLLAAVVGGTKEAHDTPGNENMTEDAEYLTIVPPSQLPTNAEEDELEISTEPANVGQARRKRLKSRAVWLCGLSPLMIDKSDITTYSTQKFSPCYNRHTITSSWWTSPTSGPWRVFAEPSAKCTRQWEEWYLPCSGISFLTWIQGVCLMVLDLFRPHPLSVVLRVVFCYRTLLIPG